MHGMILPCGCKHEFQDNQYGRGQRYHNPMAATPGGSQKWRCTVCSSVKETGKPEGKK